MKRLWMIALPITLAGIAAPAAIAQQVEASRVERVQFARGASSAMVRGRIRGYDVVDYLVNARAGQRMTVAFGARGPSTYFVIRAPGSEDNLFDGPTTGGTARLTLEESGNYRVRVFQMRNVARRGQTSNYSLTIRVDG